MKKDDIYRSQFRLPYSLYEKLKEIADANNRSVNAELIARLEESFSNNDQELTTLKKQNLYLTKALESNRAMHEDMQKFFMQVQEMLSKKD